MSDSALVLHDVSKTFLTGSLFGGRQKPIRAVRNVSLQLRRGETLAIVGESGSGKSTLARMIVGLERPTSGDIEIDGEAYESLSWQGARAFGRRVQYVFQDPIGSLNPRKTIGAILDVPLRLICGYAASRCAARKRDLLQAVGMPLDALDRYPHEFSGGQAQRIAIARSLAAEPATLVLDEPVSALDVSVQAQVLLLLYRLKSQFDLSYLLISHDLAVVEALADRVAVMYLGEIVEQAATEALFASPRHDYTRNLIRSVPRLSRTRET